MSEEMEFSLADLADLDISEVEEIRFENLPQGAYVFEVESAELDEKPNRDNEQRFIAEFKLKVVEVKAVVKKGVDPDSLIGKRHTEKFYIVPEKAQEGIGRIRAALKDMGFNNEGKLREVLEATVGQQFAGKIAVRKNPQDPSQEFASLKLDPKK